MPKDGLTVVAMVLIGSFAIERVVSAIFFVLSLSKDWDQKFPDPDLLKGAERARAARKRTLWFALASAAIVAVVLIAIPGLRILGSLDIKSNPPLGPNKALDAFVTGLILMGGADSLSGILQSSAGRSSGAPTRAPIEVTGHLTLDPPGSDRAVLGPGA